MIKCIIIEDQAPAQRILKKYISDFEGLELLKVFSNGIEALEYLNEVSVDLIFLDIHLPKISGIDFLSILNPKPLVILTTAFQDYAVQGFELDVTDYLLKPFSFDRFVKAVYKAQRLLHIIPNQKTPSINNVNELLIKVGYEYVKIKSEDIEIIKSDNDYTTLILKDKKLLTNYSLKQWLIKLEGLSFIQVHRSFIVNMNKVISYSKGIVKTNSHEIPIGRVYKKEFRRGFSG